MYHKAHLQLFSLCPDCGPAIIIIVNQLLDHT